MANAQDQSQCEPFGVASMGPDLMLLIFSQETFALMAIIFRLAEIYVASAEVLEESSPYALSGVRNGS